MVINLGIGAAILIDKELVWTKGYGNADKKKLKYLLLTQLFMQQFVLGSLRTVRLCGLESQS